MNDERASRSVCENKYYAVARLGTTEKTCAHSVARGSRCCRRAVRWLVVSSVWD